MNFLRRDAGRLVRLGKGRRKQSWRSPKGRDNKMREKRRGYPATVSIGYGSKKEGKGKIENLTPIMVSNFKDLEKVGKGNVIILGKIGIKKKIELVNKIKDKKLKIKNVNVEKFLELNKMKVPKKKENKK